jgi:single-stranded DNA-binding protein
MASFNRVILLGNITRQPQMKYLPSQMPVCEFGLATNRKFKTQGGEDREEVCYFDLAAYARPAEIINEYCNKGDPIFIEARAKYESWEDKNGGGKRSKLVFVVENFQLLGEEVTFVDCTVFGRGAEVINQYCTKGKQILVSGRLKFDSWEDKQGAGKRSKLTVVVEEFQLLGARSDAGGEEEQPAPAPQAQQRGRAPARSGDQRF